VHTVQRRAAIKDASAQQYTIYIFVQKSQQQLSIQISTDRVKSSILTKIFCEYLSRSEYWING